MDFAHWAVAIAAAVFAVAMLAIGSFVRSIMRSARQEVSENPSHGHWLDNSFAESEEARR
jgi:hypothetical protein